MRRLNLLLPVLLIGSFLGALPAPPAVAATASYQPGLPVNMTVFYPTEVKQASKVHPNRPVDYHDAEVVRNQVLDMQYGGIQVGLYSWFGRGSFPDQVFPTHLRAADDSTFRWALFNEDEGGGKNPSSTQAKADLDWIYSRYGQDPSYYRIGGKPVMFLYGDPGDTCNAAARWEAADSAHRFFIVMKVISGYTGCRPQPQGWYGYAPANGHWAQGNSYAVSPGFNKVGESGPRLGRSVSRFASDLRAMKASKTRFHIVTTWNEWTESTGVESANEWASRSGHGAYVDQMHSILGSAVAPPAPPSILNASATGQDINLSWNASSGATSYQVFRNGCLLATVSGTTYTDSSGLADESASYFVKSANYRGTSRRGPVRIGTAGTPTPAPVSTGSDGIVAIPGERVFSTSTGTGVGCAARQRGQAVLTLPASVPANATGAVLVVHALNALGNGAVQLFAVGDTASGSQVRYYSSRASSNTTLVPIGTSRQIVVQESGAATHLWIDVIGYAAPGEDGLDTTTTTPPDRVFYNSASSSATVGGVGGAVAAGQHSFALPSGPAGASAVQVRVSVSHAAAAGTINVYNGSTAPPVASLAFDKSVMLANSVLVPVAAGHTIRFTVSTSAYVTLGLEGWVQPNGQKLTVRRPTSQIANTTRVSAQDLQLPVAFRGHTVLLNLGVASALGYGNLTVSPDGPGKTANMATMSYGPQQPQSGFVWVYCPSNGVIHITLTSSALLSVDLLGDA